MTAPVRQGPRNPLSQPTLYPRVCISRSAYGIYDQVNDGVNPTLSAINFSLNDLPGFSEFTSLFQSYCLEEVEIWFKPEYTVLSDASTLSNSQNMSFYTAIDLADTNAPLAINDVLQYQSLSRTSITKTHFRKIRPAYLIDGSIPSCALISTSNATVNWLGLKIAIPPCGVAMTFRTDVKFKIAFVGAR